MPEYRDTVRKRMKKKNEKEIKVREKQDKDINLITSTTVKQIRAEQNMTQRQLSDALRLTQSQVSRLEAGTRNWSIPLLRRVAGIFKMSLSNLIERIGI